MKSREKAPTVLKPLLAVLAMTVSLVMTATPVNAQQSSIRRDGPPPWTGSNRMSQTRQATPQTSNANLETNNHDARYKVVPLGVLPGKTNLNVADLKSVNNLGHVTGWSFVHTGDFNSVFLTGQAFIWQNGKLKALPLLNGWPGASGYVLNDRDQVAGAAFKLDGSGNLVYTAVMWDHGQPTNLGTLQPNTSSLTAGINIWGVVVGGSQIPGTGSNTPVVWYGGAIHALPFLPGMDHGFAEAINDLGVIVGRQGSPDGSSVIPCLWYWNGNGYTPISLGSLGGNFGDAYAINDLGQVVGWSNYAGDLHGPAFVWDWRGMHALPLLPGYTDGQGFNINDLGQITGANQIFDDNGNFIFGTIVIWENGTVTDLDTLVPAGTPGFTDVANINALGQIGIDSGYQGDGTVAGYLLVHNH
jgi:probable HAF family extracellular repeat protein